MKVLTVTLLFSHRVSGNAAASNEYFADATAALNASGDPVAPVHKFSRLGALESFRESDGLFHLRQSWPLTGVSCLDILRRNAGAPSGSYLITPTNGSSSLVVWCDMVADGGGYVS